MFDKREGEKLNPIQVVSEVQFVFFWLKVAKFVNIENSWVSVVARAPTLCGKEMFTLKIMDRDFKVYSP